MLDRNKFAIGTRWLDEYESGYVVIGHDSDGITVTEKIKGEEQYSIRTWSVNPEVIPYEDMIEGWVGVCYVHPDKETVQSIIEEGRLSEIEAIIKVKYRRGEGL